MADIVPPEKRSEMMSGIRSKDTIPELLIRKGLFSKGYRYRLHRKDLPGKPDLVLPKYSAVVFVHGCFWHGHDCHLFKWPKTRVDFWREKISSNIARGKRDIETLTSNGWRTLIVWECCLKGSKRRELEEVIGEAVKWLKSDDKFLEIRS